MGRKGREGDYSRQEKGGKTYALVLEMGGDMSSQRGVEGGKMRDKKKGQDVS